MEEESSDIRRKDVKIRIGKTSKNNSTTTTTTIPTPPLPTPTPPPPPPPPSPPLSTRNNNNNTNNNKRQKKQHITTEGPNSARNCIQASSLSLPRAAERQRRS
ncbi:hypothetical protein E2C01_097727 [Portunus trituberculatus]|uniref:Uncharacterized protein n=1 Tax=Portunus trituberculatus TaxID=210409 RepID=A0A5B7K6F9_PORTR|nr:hypothetical protein [Portunus trituberculatus]